MSANQDLIREIRAPPVESTAFALRRSAFKRTVDRDEAIDTLGPYSQTRAMVESCETSSTLVQFFNTGDQVNIPQQVRSSLPAVASGYRLLPVSPR